MSTFILLAALASQITFSTSQQANMTTIIPQVTLADACECQVEVLSVRQGQGGTKYIAAEKYSFYTR